MYNIVQCVILKCSCSLQKQQTEVNFTDILLIVKQDLK